MRYIDPDGHFPIIPLIILALLATACSSQTSSIVNVTENPSGAPSQGTQINENTVLTHNHYDSNSFTVTDSAGNTFTTTDNPADGVSQAVGQDVVIKGTNYGPQTRLITFPNQQLSGEPAPIASQQVISNLQAGDQVQIAGQVGMFEISSVNISGGYLTVSDPTLLIQGGASGGGVFYNGELIGNLWAIIMDKTTRDALGEVWVALIPPGIDNSDSAYNPKIE